MRQDDMRKFQRFVHAHSAVKAVIAGMAADENPALARVRHLLRLIAVNPLGIAPHPRESKRHSPKFRRGYLPGQHHN
jgi:hypothetical protein